MVNNEKVESIRTLFTKILGTCTQRNILELLRLMNILQAQGNSAHHQHTPRQNQIPLVVLLSVGCF